MSAQEQMRAMLDQLMGTARNGESDKGIRFYDTSVCKSFLLQCCPHEILSSTRMDLGDCHKIHDLALRADFEQASKTKDYFYDIDATEHLLAFIADCDRRTSAAKLRLAETQDELTAEVAVKANSVHDLAEQIGKKLAKAEALGEDGLVDESMKLMEEVDQLRKTKSEAEQEYRNSMPASSYQQQKLRVCEVCSAYLGIHDNDRRLADHFGGKLHLGFITIRDKLADLSSKLNERREERKRLDDRCRDRNRDRDRDRGDRDRRQYAGGRELDRRARRHRSRDRHSHENPNGAEVRNSGEGDGRKTGAAGSRRMRQSDASTVKSERRSNSRSRSRSQRSIRHSPSSGRSSSKTKDRRRD